MTRFFVFVPNTTLRQLYQLNDDTTGAVFIYLPDPGQVAVVQARLRQRLEDEGFRLMERDARPFWDKLEIVNREAWAGQKLDVTQWEDDLDFVKIVLPALRGLGGFLVFLLLVVIGLGLMNSMWVMIRARTREIGTLRAIGMSRGAVVRMVVAEALALGAVASATGAAAGWVICWAINRVQVQVPEALQAVMMRDTLFLNTDLPAVVASTVLITLFLGLVGLLPALKASRLKPVVALQHTG